MSTPFPAVIKEIRLGVTETVLTLDVSVPDVHTLAGLLDREVSVLITEPQGAPRTPVSGITAVPVSVVGAEAPFPGKLPFEPDDAPASPEPCDLPPVSPPPPPPTKPRSPRRPARTRK